MKVRTLLVAALTLCIALVAVTPAFAASPVKVDNMVNKTSFGYAVKWLKANGMKVVIGPPTYSNTIRAHYVGVQSPYGNLKRGTSVTLRESVGKKPAYKWRTAVSSNYGNEPQPVAGPYPHTEVMDAKDMPYFANKHMEFGTKVIFKHNGKTIVGFCADRGPYVSGRSFDMGTKIMRALGLDGVDHIQWAYVK